MRTRLTAIIKILSLVALILVIFLEAIPYGVKMTWKSDTMSSTSYHSYFDSIPYGYGDVGPLFCAIISVLLFALMFTSIFIALPRWVDITMLVLAVIATLFSLMPMAFDGYTVVGGFISAIMLVLSEAMLFICKNSNTKS